MLQNYSFCASLQNVGAAKCALRKHKAQTTVFQLAAFRRVKDHLLPHKRPSFASQKTAFYNALEINTLQRQPQNIPKHGGNRTQTSRAALLNEIRHRCKNIAKNLAVWKNLTTFALAFEHKACLPDNRRDGRVVDYNGLENRRAERHRGFESLSLRKETLISNDLRNYKRNALNLHNSGRFHFYKPTPPHKNTKRK